MNGPFSICSQIHRQHRQPLIDVVVQVARDPPAIFFLRRQKLPCQRSQLLSILLKLPFPGLQRGFARRAATVPSLYGRQSR